MRMNKKNKTTLVPKLRFPEYESAKEWVEKPLGDVTYSVSQKNSEGKKYPIYSINNKKGFLPQSDQFEGVDSNSRGYDIRLYKIVDKNTFAYNPARINVGSIGYSGELFDIIISSLYVCFKTNEEIEDNFLQCFLATSTFKRQVENNTEGGIRSYLFYENFSKILLQFPQKHEQQKIADCLSSLDDLIIAENRKLEALKMHKKGLMHKLFPAEGKTVPEWRFPEFRDSSEWTINPLCEICENLDSRRIPITERDRKKGSTPYFGASGIIDYVDGFIFDEALLCVSEDGANLVARTYPIAFSISGKTWVNNYAHVLKFHNDFTQVLVENYLNSIDLSDFLTGMAQPKLNRAKLDIIPVPLPKEKEQQKIADCLSALDTLITTQAEKIESLKTHKKGLMQGLFPSLEEVCV